MRGGRPGDDRMMRIGLAAAVYLGLTMIPDKFTAANRALALLGALLVAGATAGVIGILLYPALLLTCVIVGASGPVKYWATIGGWLNDKLASNKIPTFLRFPVLTMHEGAASGTELAVIRALKNGFLGGNDVFVNGWQLNYEIIPHVIQWSIIFYILWSYFLARAVSDAFFYARRTYRRMTGQSRPANRPAPAAVRPTPRAAASAQSTQAQAAPSASQPGPSQPRDKQAERQAFIERLQRKQEEEAAKLAQDGARKREEAWERERVQARDALLRGDPLGARGFNPLDGAGGGSGFRSDRNRRPRGC